MGKILKNVLIVFGCLFLLFNVIDVLYPYQTKQVINFINNKVEKISDDNVIELDKDYESGLFTLSAKVNGVDMNFILDTGCSSLQMSNLDFKFLKRQGVINEYDYITDMLTTNADGITSSNKVYNINTLEIGGYKIKNVMCIVSNSPDAMLLLGQEVLSEFKNVTISYKNHTLTLEK